MAYRRLPAQGQHDYALVVRLHGKELKTKDEAGLAGTVR